MPVLYDFYVFLGYNYHGATVWLPLTIQRLIQGSSGLYLLSLIPGIGQREMIAFTKIRSDWRCARHDSVPVGTALPGVSASTTKSL